MSNIIALIPARSGSKGVPNKNIRDLAGFPLIAWSIKASLNSYNINRTIVSTDSQEYADIATSFGAEVPFLRPSVISEDTSSDFQFVKHAIDWLIEHNDYPEYIVHIRPTTPFRDLFVIDKAINTFLQETTASSLRSVHQMSESAYKSFEIGKDNYLRMIGSESRDLDIANSARQSFPATYCANGYVDVLSVEFIQKHSLLHGSSVVPFITDRIREIDVEDDFTELIYEASLNPKYRSRLFGI